MKIFGRKKKEPVSDKPLILVVDDEEDICYIIAMALIQHGYDVDVANDGEAGLALIRSRRPALVLLDIMMPVLNGYQTLARMQQDPEMATIPVIILTSLDDTQENTQEEWARRLGVSQFLAKPIDPETIIQAVTTQLALAQGPSRQSPSE